DAAPDGGRRGSRVRALPRLRGGASGHAPGRARDALAAGSALTGLGGPKHRQRLVGVLVHVQLAADAGEQAPVGADDERGAAVEQWTRPLDAERLGDPTVGVRQQREVEVVLGGELLLALDRVGADAEAASPEGAELGTQVAEMAALRRAARRHRLGVEEQDHGALTELLVKADGLAVVGHELEVGYLVT